MPISLPASPFHYRSHPNMAPNRRSIRMHLLNCKPKHPMTTESLQFEATSIEQTNPTQPNTWCWKDSGEGPSKWYYYNCEKTSNGGLGWPHNWLLATVKHHAIILGNFHHPQSTTSIFTTNGPNSLSNVHSSIRVSFTDRSSAYSFIDLSL